MSVQVFADDASGELRSLSGWLGAEDALRGRIRLVAAPPRAGAMGAATGNLLVILGPGGLATAFAAILIAWIRSRTGAISVALSRKDGTMMRLDANNVRELTHEQVNDLANRLSALLPADAAGPDGDPGR